MSGTDPPVTTVEVPVQKRPNLASQTKVYGCPADLLELQVAESPEADLEKAVAQSRNRHRESATLHPTVKAMRVHMRISPCPCKHPWISREELSAEPPASLPEEETEASNSREAKNEAPADSSEEAQSAINKLYPGVDIVMLSSSDTLLCKIGITYCLLGIHSTNQSFCKSVPYTAIGVCTHRTSTSSIA